MRWYLLRCIDCAVSIRLAPTTVWCEHKVTVSGGVIEAFAKAREDGYWPVGVIKSDWAEQPANPNS